MRRPESSRGQVIVVRLVRLALLLVIGGSCLVIFVERRAQAVVNDRRQCFADGTNTNELGDFDNDLTMRLAVACGQRDPIPGVRLIQPEEAPPSVEASVPPPARYIGTISQVSVTGLVVTDVCGDRGDARTSTALRFSRTASAAIPSPTAASGVEEVPLDRLASQDAGQAWELTMENGEITRVFPWFLPCPNGTTSLR